MSLTANVTISVPPLTDNQVWFANADAWTNYWKQITSNVTFTPVNNTVYVPVAYDNNLVPVILNIGGESYVIITVEMFTSLKNRVEAMELSYRNLRTDLKDMGLIQNSQ